MRDAGGELVNRWRVDIPVGDPGAVGKLIPDRGSVRVTAAAPLAGDIHRAAIRECSHARERQPGPGPLVQAEAAGLVNVVAGVDRRGRRRAGALRDVRRKCGIDRGGRVEITDPLAVGQLVPDI